MGSAGGRPARSSSTPRFAVNRGLCSGMWTFSQHASYGNAAAVVALTTAVYVGWNVASSIVARRAVNRALQDQNLYEPPSLPLLGHTLDLMIHHKDRFHDWFTEQCLAAGGRPWVLRIIGRPPTLVLTSPREIEDVFKTQVDIFEKGPEICETAYDFFGEGIIGVDGEKWLKQRRTGSHLFSMTMLRDTMDAVVVEKSLKLRDVLADCARLNKSVSMKSLLSKLSSDVFTKIGFGVDLDGLGGDVDVEMEHPFIKAVETFGSVFQSRLQSPMWLWRLKKRLGVGEEGELRHARKVVHELVMEIMQKSLAHKKSATKQQKDLITLFMETMDSTADVMDVRDTVMNFFLAGKDTTSFSMSWMIVNMNRFPRVLDKIRAEINANLPELLTGELEAPTMSDLQKLPYLEAAMKESLRLYMSTVHRAPNQSTTLSDGVHVPFGTHVIVPTYAMGRMPSVWGPDASEYRPERWIGEDGRVLKVSPFKFFSFLAGPHQCLGMRFALLEMQTVMAVLLSRFDIKTVEDPFEITYDYSLVIPVKGPLMVNVHDLSIETAARGLPKMALQYHLAAPQQ